MPDNQYGGLHPVVLQLVIEFNEREGRAYEERRATILQMLDDAEALLEAGRKPVPSAD